MKADVDEIKQDPNEASGIDSLFKREIFLQRGMLRLIGIDPGAPFHARHFLNVPLGRLLVEVIGLAENSAGRIVFPSIFVVKTRLNGILRPLRKQLPMNDLRLNFRPQAGIFP